MLDQRRITAAIMKLWAPHVEARALGPPHHRGQVMHPRQLLLTIPCISRTVVGQQGHSLLQASMPDDEEIECAPSKRKFLNWTPLAFLNSLGHTTGFSMSKAPSLSPPLVVCVDALRLRLLGLGPSLRRTWLYFYRPSCLRKGCLSLHATSLDATSCDLQHICGRQECQQPPC